MTRQPKGTKKRSRSIQVWTYAQAQSALPYINSIVSSLREHALEVLAHRRRLQRLDNKAGRPDRSALIAMQEANRQLLLAEGRFEDAADELQELDIYSLDPVQGTALIPFVHKDELAWFIFDLFDSRPLSFWRFQSDPEDTRRPITSMQKGPAPTQTA
jgi:hypothetical protein